MASVTTTTPPLSEDAAAAAAATTTVSSPSKAVRSQTTVEVVEDSSTVHLRRAWRSFVSTIVVATRTADKEAKKDVTTATATAVSSTVSKELDEAVVSVLRGRITFRRGVAHVESKLTGQAQETEALEGCMKSQPSVGHRKRKLPQDDTTTTTTESPTATATAATTV